MNTAPAPGTPRGPGRPRSLTDAQVERIRVLASEGTPQRSIAEHFEISPTLVSMIVRGIRYPDAPGPIPSTTKTGQTA
ncbi:helix-turn-helix DNA binding domain protein [Arthrobacter phage Altadena]|uniref:Helix-turn-helix DNA binding domain protein n=1 Tax=Arthrobacter phage Altadena TaxID=3059064 RepID=A0AA96KHM4_9CAUD|nr:helix-turn-helix DNA binding domain protein [Arthrobacter phage Altadena]